MKQKAVPFPCYLLCIKVYLDTKNKNKKKKKKKKKKNVRFLFIESDYVQY